MIQRLSRCIQTRRGRLKKRSASDRQDPGWLEYDMIAQKNPEIRKAVDTLYELSADPAVRAEYEHHKASWARYRKPENPLKKLGNFV